MRLLRVMELVMVVMMVVMEMEVVVMVSYYAQLSKVQLSCYNVKGEHKTITTNHVLYIHLLIFRHLLGPR